MNESYVYPGMPAFLVSEGVMPSFVGKITSSFLVSRVNDALSQIPATAPANRAGMYDEARALIHALNCCTQTVLAAFDDVMKHCPPLKDEEVPDATIDPHAAKRPLPEHDTPLAPEPAVTPHTGEGPKGKGVKP